MRPVVHRLAFGLYGRRAGVIERNGPRQRLTYDEDYSNDRNATPLSLSLPLAIAPARSSRAVGAYLAGLLPDHDDVRERLALQHGVKAGDILGLIAAIGRDCAGGAVFAPEDQLDEALNNAGSVEPIDDGQIANRLRALRRDQSAWQDEDEHWSLAGAQGKFTLARLGEGWGLATGSAPSTHIVKPGIAWLDHQALAEHVSMRAMALAGLPVAETRFEMFEDQPAIVATRFDRRVGRNGRVARIHQEDTLQALALMPQRKYESDGGPGVARIAELLRASVGPQGAANFVEGVIANYLLGAPDAHAKNFSLLLAGTRATLAPAYDVSTGLLATPSGRLYRTAPMSIGGEKRFGDVEAAHWRKFAAAAGVDADWVHDRVAALATAIPQAFAAALDELPDDVEGLADLRAVTLPAIAAVDAQTVAGLTRTRRVDGRVLVPFMDTINPRSTAAQGTEELDHWDTPAGD
ncbi:type II toxin-antitoxin system HipA family toxin [Luteimicrobium sp. DT211]|uniref:type II toxin-antitoxin system HipA family toxin n=1 Tax=Luteimicrobium sp. DT211 TaxID=3393412 RepID=UPI003CFB6D1B